MSSSPAILHYDAFSNIPNRGNPAGVVLNAEHLTDDDMQSIAKRVGFNETAFVLGSEQANHRLRFFTPGHEMPLCGHATVASTLALVESQQTIGNNMDFVFETLAGLIDVQYRFDCTSGVPAISMKQAPAQFKEFSGSKAALSDVLGVRVSEIHPNLPVVYGNTGTWTLLVPMLTVDIVRKMIPKTSDFPGVLNQMPRSSIHPFTLETIHSGSHMHARHFSSPFSGTIEDPVTGTASGVMGAYMAKYSPSFYSNREKIAVIEQGFDVGRDGRVTVEVLSNQAPYSVKITGSAVWVGEL